MTQTTPVLTLAAVDGAQVEKFNAAEQGGSHDHKRGRRGRNRNRKNTDDKARGSSNAYVDPGKPTPERLAKTDGIAKTPSGHYRAPPPIERLRDRQILDPSIGYVNEAMYQAAMRFEELFYTGGLTSSVAAQDLSRVIVHGGGDLASRGMAAGERELYCRQKWREAVKIMGYFEAYPHRGASRLVIDVICYGMGVKEAAAVHCPGGSAERQSACGMDRLREGLFTLAKFWRLC